MPDKMFAHAIKEEMRAIQRSHKSIVRPHLTLSFYCYAESNCFIFSISYHSAAAKHIRAMKCIYSLFCLLLLKTWVFLKKRTGCMQSSRTAKQTADFLNNTYSSLNGLHINRLIESNCLFFCIHNAV